MCQNFSELFIKQKIEDKFVTFLGPQTLIVSNEATPNLI